MKKELLITYKEACYYARQENWLWVKGYLYQQFKLEKIFEDEYEYLINRMEQFEEHNCSEGQFYQLLLPYLKYREPTYTESLLIME